MMFVEPLTLHLTTKVFGYSSHCPFWATLFPYVHFSAIIQPPLGVEDVSAIRPNVSILKALFNIRARAALDQIDRYAPGFKWN